MIARRKIKWNVPASQQDEPIVSLNAYRKLNLKKYKKHKKQKFQIMNNEF